MSGGERPTSAGGPVSEAGTVRYRELDTGVALLEIDRPHVHNALDRTAQYAFDEGLARACDNPAIGAVVLAGTGEKALSAGWDIGEMRSLSPEANLALLLEREDWLWRWYSCPVPTVVAMRGICYGAGALLSACADLRVGGPGTRFKVTGIGYGYANLTWILPDLLGESRAKQILLTGGVASGEKAAELGLLAECVPDERILPAALELAATVAALPPNGVRTVKRLIREGSGRDVRARFDAENLLEREAVTRRSADDVFASFIDRRAAAAGPDPDRAAPSGSTDPTGPIPTTPDAGAAR